MPWLHLHIDTGGRVKACCEANITFGNINDQNVKEIWQGEPIRKFRRSLIEGKRDNRCASCFVKEDAGKSSMRTETLEKFSHRMDWVHETDASGIADQSNPIYFDIRFNNLCNLRCRTCWHGASSSWFEEAKILKQNMGNKAIVEATKDSSTLIHELLNQSIAVEEIYFAGGEPLMMQAHYDLLEGLIERHLTDVHLRYNTNLSVLQVKERSVLELWKSFPNITVSASVDGMGKQGEYIRKGLIWDRFLANMKSIKRFLPYVKLEIAPTISVFNVFDLDQLHCYFVDQKLIDINSIYLNVLTRPDYYNIKSLPVNEKKAVKMTLNSHIQWLAKFGASTSIIDEFKSVITFIQQEDWTHQLPNLKKQLKLLDEMRSENYEIIFPELKQVLDLV